MQTKEDAGRQVIVITDFVRVRISLTKSHCNIAASIHILAFIADFSPWIKENSLKPRPPGR